MSSYAGRDWPDIDPGEIDIFSFDFKRWFADGETISSAVWDCAVATESGGTDAGPASRLLGAPFADPDSATITAQRAGGFLAGVRYRLRALVTTSNGNVKAMYSHVTCRAPA